MTTNAMLLDKYMSYLEKHKVNLLISLDGNQVHNSYRIDKQGNPSFNKVFHNSTGTPSSTANQNANDYNGYTITGPNEVMCVCRNGGTYSIASNI